jgi:hypothetical protein
MTKVKTKLTDSASGFELLQQEYATALGALHSGQDLAPDARQRRTQELASEYRQRCAQELDAMRAQMEADTNGSAQ